MKNTALLIFFIFTATLTKAQNTGEYGADDRAAFSIPAAQSQSTTGIAAFITAHFKYEKDKARAIYAWVTSNLTYNIDSANIINGGIDPEAKITLALKRRKGVCENFSAIYNDISLKSGLTSFVVAGYTKQGGHVDKSGHSWCAVLIDKKWYLCDPTWDQGNIMNTKYFLVSPAEFIESHMPFDPLWQLLPYPVSHEQFYGGNMDKTTGAAYFNFYDSVAAYLQLDSLQKLEATAHRMEKMGLYNPRIKDNYNSVRMDVEIINQDKDADLYNSSIQDLNTATSVLNTFINYRNNQFVPEKTDADLRDMLQGLDTQLHATLQKLDEVDKSRATLTLSTDELRSRVKIMLDKVSIQKKFLDQYLGTAENGREALFY